MQIKFTKMHALGNDFMVINALTQSIDLSPSQITTWSNRHTGIGFDQLLVLEPSSEQNIDFNYRIFNANGHEVGQCGNGARCLAAFIEYYALSPKKILRVATKKITLKLTLNGDKSISMSINGPELQPALIPFKTTELEEKYLLEVAGGQYEIHSLSVGNPHAILLVADVDQTPVQNLGKQISEHTRFPEQANVSFMQIVNSERIKLRVYERHCGETLACGSAALAAGAIGRLYYKMQDLITVSLPGGDVQIYWPDIQKEIVLTGSATFVYEGLLF